MAEIKAADVGKLRKVSGAGMMDCKKALVEAEGDFDAALEIIRKKGQALANKRADKDATEGVVIAKANADGTKGALLVINCETDFVAKNDDFVNFAHSILDAAIANTPSNLDALKTVSMDGKAISDVVIEKTGVVGEKIEVSGYELIEASQVVAYIHPGNKIATLVGLSKNVDSQIGRDVAMQIAAMNPVALDKDNVPQDVVEKELEIGREQARQQGKPEQILDKIAEGKLNKFFKDNTLLNQDFVKDNKKTIKQYLQESDKELTVTSFKRLSLGN